MLYFVGFYKQTTKKHVYDTWFSCLTAVFREVPGLGTDLMVLSSNTTSTIPS